MPRPARPWMLLALVPLVIGLPLLGAIWAGRNLQHLAAFPPPLDLPAASPRFSWLASAALVFALAGLVLAWTRHARLPGDSSVGRSRAVESSKSFPWWGTLSLVWTLGWWLLAWTRFPWFHNLQLYTFFPLWCGFVVTLNAWTQRRVGTCFMRRDPPRWLALFGASGVFWWGFEWLNRFVQNWHYLGVERLGPVPYAVHATLCFSTVLPAVAAVAEALATYPAWNDGWNAGPAWRWIHGRRTAAGLMAFGAVALVLTGVFPQTFYPALWSAPLALGLGEEIWSGRGGVTGEIARGQWSRAGTWMSAALLCGLFWELWNWRSLAKWSYTVPGVDRWHVFEMPLLGYSGYLPFGLECLVVASWLGLTPTAPPTGGRGEGDGGRTAG